MKTITEKERYLIDLSMQIEKIKYELNKMDQFDLDILFGQDQYDIIIAEVENLIRIYELDKDLAPIGLRSKYDYK